MCFPNSSLCAQADDQSLRSCSTKTRMLIKQKHTLPPSLARDQRALCLMNEQNRLTSRGRAKRSSSARLIAYGCDSCEARGRTADGERPSSGPRDRKQSELLSRCSSLLRGDGALWWSAASSQGAVKGCLGNISVRRRGESDLHTSWSNSILIRQRHASSQPPLHTA